MVYSSLASTRGDSPKRSSREGTTVDTFLIHHMASTDGVGSTNMMLSSGGRTVSANYTIWSDGTIHGVVPEEFRAWTSGSATDGGKGAAWDRRSITVEIANESGDPDWRISAKAIDAAARLLNDLRRRYKIANVLGHRDLWERYGASYPTYCPGPNTVATIVATANDTGSPAGIEEDDMTPEQSKMLTQVFNAVCKDGSAPKDWSMDHQVDWIRRQHSEQVVNSPGGPQKKWTMYHVLDWQSRQAAETLAQIKGLQAAVEALASAQGVDAKDIQKTVSDAVKKALSDLTITLSTEED